MSNPLIGMMAKQAVGNIGTTDALVQTANIAIQRLC